MTLGARRRDCRPGTPDGVGFARTPPEFLKDGDVMEVEIERIGVLRNAVAIKTP